MSERVPAGSAISAVGLALELVRHGFGWPARVADYTVCHVDVDYLQEHAVE